MKKLSLLLMFFAIVFMVNAQKIRMMSSTADETIIEMRIGDYSLVDVVTPNGIEKKVMSEGATFLQKKDAPDLVKYSEALVIPDKSKMYVEVLESEYVDIPDISIAPSKGVITRNIDPATVPFEYGPEYTTDEFFPSNIASLSEPFIMRDIRGISVQMNPFQYNPVTRTLRVYTRLVVRTYASDEVDDVNVLPGVKSGSKIQEDFQHVYSRFFLNYSTGNAKYTPLAEQLPGRMLVICYDNFLDEMQPFVDWKNQKGITTEIVGISTIGNNASSISTYVSNYYSTHSDFAYLLLVGDDSQVTSSSTGAGDSDNEYGYLAGSDHYIDIFVGRFSAQNAAQVTTQVDRTIHYEKDVTTSETWMAYGLVVASNEGAGMGDDGESDIQHNENMETDLLNYGYLGTTQCFQGEGGTSTTITNAINDHIGVATYTGHGNTQEWSNVNPSGYTNTHVNALTNTNKLPFIFTVACVSGDFTSNTCFGEAWQRATDGSGDPTGAIANIASTINQSWQSPMCAQDEMIDVLVESYASNIKRTFGGISACGWGQMIDEYGTDGENMADTWTCFGDASVLVRTKQPQAIVLTNQIVSPGTFTTQVNVGGSPFEDALVSIYQDGDVPYAAMTDASGNVTITHPFTGTVYLTVTGYNLASFQIETTVTVPDPPVCNFTADQTTVTAGTTINFTDLSTNFPSIWNWDFDGGATASTVQNPSVPFNTPGTYTVTLYCENTAGNDTEVKTDYIVVNPVSSAPVADFSASVTTITPGSTVDFTDLSTNLPTGWSWTFTGANTTSSTAQNPTGIQYDTPGVYNVSLTASNGFGSDTETKVGYIVVEAIDPCAASSTSTTYEYISNVTFNTIDNTTGSDGYADYTAMSTDINQGDTYTFSVTYTDNYTTNEVLIWIDWNCNGDFNDAGESYALAQGAGTGSPYTTNITVPMSATATSTTMRVRLHDAGWNPMADPCGDSGSGEVEDYTVNVISAGPTLPVANFSASPTTLCAGMSVDFTDLSTDATSWSWSFPGGIPSTSTNQNPSGIVYTAAGTYDVILTASNAAGSDSETKVGYIIVGDSPTLSASATDVLCYGEATGSIDLTATGGITPYTYTWSPSGTGEDPTGLTAGTYNVTVADAAGCTSTTSATVNQPASGISVSTSVTDATCGGSDGSAIAFATGGTPTYTYAWSSGGTTDTETGLAAGTYNVTVTDANGCQETSSATVSELGGPTVSVSVTDATCNGTCDGAAIAIVSGGASPYTYTWSSGGTADTEINLCAGSYTVTVTDDNGCDAVASFNITEPTAIVVTITTDVGTATASATGGASPYTYAWSNGETTATISDLPTGDYTVTVTDANGCTGTETASVTGVGITEAKDANFTVYPNPTSGMITVKTSNMDVEQIRVLDVLGKAVKVVNVSSDMIRMDLGDFETGMYFIEMYSAQKTYTTRIVVE